MNKRIVFLLAVVLSMMLMTAGLAFAVNCEKQPAQCCFNVPIADPTVCSGHGVCQGYDSCLCTAGWVGADCSEEEKCGLTGCNKKCGSNGVCTSRDGGPLECFCDGEKAMGYCCEIPILLPILPTLTPAGLDFGSVSVGATSQAQTATITNLLATNLQTITLSGANSADFSLVGSCTAGATLPQGVSCSNTVAFTPGDPGTRSAILTITTTSPDTTLTVTLTGTGTISASSIVIDPVTPTILYAGLDGAGVYKKTAITDWTAMNILPANARVKAVVIKPGDSTKLFAGIYGNGVYYSANSGVDWSVCKDSSFPYDENKGLTNLNVVSLTIDATGKLYAGTEAGVFMSVDSCTTWSAINSGLPN